MSLCRASLAVLALAAAAPAYAADPPVPLGQDPGGTAVALLTTGIDYRDPAVAMALARDGEGEPVAWDFIDNDNRPFESEGHGTALAAILAKGRGRLVAVRVDPKDPMSLARAVAFVQRTPARLVVVPFTSARPEDWEPFDKAARHVAEMLFVAPAGGYPAALALDNLAVISTSPEGAVQAVSAFLSCGGTLQAATGRERKEEFMKAAKPAPDPAEAVIEPCP